jgi:hypothetical protein
MAMTNTHTPTPEELEAEGWQLFKFQKPIATNTEPMCLVYNEDRTQEFCVPMKLMEGLFADGEYKVFGWARIGERGFLEGHPTMALVPNEEEPYW